jgi:hypothetical protein
VEDLDSDTEAQFYFEERKALDSAEAGDHDYTVRNSDASANPHDDRRTSNRIAIKRAKSSL